jgi:predicted metalloenzyme YecM
MITDNLHTFIKQKLDQLQSQNINVLDLELDHFGYQTAFKEDYDTKTKEVNTIAVMKSENIVGGRRVGIYKLNTPYIYENYTVLGFELVEPREGQVCNSQLDHLEFVLKSSFDDYIAKNTTVNWDTTAMTRPEFAKLTVKFEDGTSVKFHLKNIFEEIPNK